MAKAIIGSISPERIRELLTYDPQTGVFHWRVIKGRRAAGEIAGGIDHDQYRRIGIDRHLHMAHRLAWVWMTGLWPKDQLDHINGIRDDNRFTNLREASNTLNGQNRHKANKNKLKFMGVSQAGKKFRACIGVDGNVIHIGNFATPEEAHAAYLAAKRKWHPGWHE